MLPIKGLYEVAIPVRNLESAERFYRGVLGLEEGLRDTRRRWLFLRAGGDDGMIVLQETPDAWHPLHFAFTIDEADVDRAAAALRAHGVTVDGPHRHDWMPALSLYFADPDGHDVELCAPLRR
jgi:catechol 2,3-dioxygenase-like lactoylglutathione lyase family enzyme